MRAYLALLLAVVACGDDSNHGLPDSASGIDTSLPIDGALPSVSVTVTLTGTPQAGVPVYFLNQDSTVVSSTTTDASGTASAMMMAGGSVTVLAPPNPSAVASTNIYTWEAVRGGDKLKLDLDPPSVATTATITVTVPVDGAAVGYTLYSACAGPTSLTTDGNNTVVLTNCGATTDLLLVTSDGTGAPIDEIFVPAAAVADGDTVAFAGPYIAVGQTTYSYTNVAADVVGVKTIEQLTTGSGMLYFGGVTDVLTTGAATGTQPFPTATGSIDIFETQFLPNVAAIGELDTLEWGPANAAYALDVSTLALPEYATAPAVIATTSTHKVEWTEDIGGQTPDFSWVTFDVSRTGATIPSWTWNIMDSHPPNDQITIPTLPTDIFDYNPNDTDTTQIDQLTTGKLPGGYDVIRPIIYDLQQGPGPLITGASGSISLEELAPPPIVSGIRKVRDPFRLHQVQATAPAKRVRNRW